MAPEDQAQKVYKWAAQLARGIITQDEYDAYMARLAREAE